MNPDAGPVGPTDHLLRRAVPDGKRVDGARLIDAEKVVQVALNPDDELRNLQVALLYSLTSTRMAERIERGRGRGAHDAVNANWFTIAQWAVLTVGRNLRTGDVPHRAAALPAGLRRRLTPAVLSLRSADDRRVAAALSYGQVMVFASIYRALLQTRFADGVRLPDPNSDVLDDPPPVAVVKPEPVRGEPEAIASVDVAGLADMVDSYVTEKQVAAEAAARADEAERATVKQLAAELGADVSGISVRQPKEDFYSAVLDALALKAGYQSELLRAFSLYEQAAPWCEERADPTRTPADLIFEATLRITAVEQVILDEAVTLVVDHLPRHLAEQLEGRLATFAERSLRVPRRIAQVTASSRIAAGAAVAKDVWARVMTDQVLVVAFPAETIRLGRDIPRRDWRQPFYAPDLQTLSPQAGAVFDQFDRSLGDGRGAGAGDWRRFDDRMNFAANMVRSRQQDSTLFWQPFTDEDVARVWSGAYPARIADPFEQAVRSPSFPGDLDPAQLDTVSCEEVAEQRAGPLPFVYEEPAP